MASDFEREMEEEMEENQLDSSEEMQSDNALSQYEVSQAYGSPEPEEKHNQHTFLATSLYFNEPEKVTFMSESELGVPLFNLRFLLDIEDIAKYYLDDTAKDLELRNKIADYFREKINNICSSGMSNKGFVQNLNVTKRMDTTRHRIRSNRMKGGNVPATNDR